MVNPDGRVIELPGGFSMISVGYSNRTPWDSPRELDEDDLRKVIDAEVAKLADPQRAIFNLHVPPKDTPIDQAMELDAEFRPVVKGGSPVITGVGSSAVRDAIAEYQPMLSLHGHIHESRGEARIGRRPSRSTRAASTARASCAASSSPSPRRRVSVATSSSPVTDG